MNFYHYIDNYSYNQKKKSYLQFFESFLRNNKPKMKIFIRKVDQYKLHD